MSETTITPERLREHIDRLEFEKPRLADWTDWDEIRLQIAKELQEKRADNRQLYEALVMATNCVGYLRPSVMSANSGEEWEMVNKVINQAREAIRIYESRGTKGGQDGASSATR